MYIICMNYEFHWFRAFKVGVVNFSNTWIFILCLFVLAESRAKGSDFEND